jgi:plasmid maintenance system antidote protein VapI
MFDFGGYMIINKEIAAIVAASIAAFISSINLIYSIYNQKRAEDRSAYRNLLKRHYNILGELLHQSVAISDVMAKRISKGQSIEGWIRKGTKVKVELEYQRRQVRYSLWGIDKGLRIVTRVSNWVAHCKCVPNKVNEIVVEADKLTKLLDKIIMRSYTNGCQPGLIARLAVKYRVLRLERKYRTIKSVRNTR